MSALEQAGSDIIEAAKDTTKEAMPLAPTISNVLSGL